MNLSELKNTLSTLNTLAFKLPNGTLVPKHFHVTEVAQVTKKYIDCGGTFRDESAISLQLWSADDYDHRLHPDKFKGILELAEDKLNLDNTNVEVEYQGNTIETYNLAFDGEAFLLETKFTDCLAKDACGIPEEKQKVNMADLSAASSNTCTPGSGCC